MTETLETERASRPSTRARVIAGAITLAVVVGAAALISPVVQANAANHALFCDGLAALDGDLAALLELRTDDYPSPHSMPAATERLLNGISHRTTQLTADSPADIATHIEYLGKHLDYYSSWLKGVDEDSRGALDLAQFNARAIIAYRDDHC